MTNLLSLLSNKVLIAALCAQLSSQAFKVIRFWWKEKKIRFDRIAAYGDFPSAHTAFITAGTLTAGFLEGWNSSIFALGVIFSAIVISDALVLRSAIAKTQKILEEIHKKTFFDPPFHGHTFPEIIGGFIVGIFWTGMIILFWPW